MCIKLQKPLNPQAPEYRRKQAPPPPLPMPLLPHIIVPPHPLHLSAPSPPHTIPQLKLQPYVYRPRPRYTILHTHYTHYLHPIPTTFPARPYPPKTTDAAAPPARNEDTVAASPPSDAKQETVPSPKCPHLDVIKKCRRRLPPRIRKAILARAPAPPPPPPPPERKLECRPKVAANIHAGGAARSSPPMTTLMIKNIPNHLRRESMLKFLDGYCKTHSVAYDFFYLPIDFQNCDNGNLGYAFVNFTTNGAAKKMKKVLNNYKWGGGYAEKGEFFYSRKICEMRWARVQGKEALIRRFKTSKFKCKEEEFLPVILDPPRDGSDPNPPAPVIIGKLSL